MCHPRGAPGVTNGFARWMPDGRALSYINMQGDSRVWMQPLDGGPPRELADFKSGRGVNVRPQAEGPLRCKQAEAPERLKVCAH